MGLNFVFGFFWIADGTGAYDFGHKSEVVGKGLTLLRLTSDSVEAWDESPLRSTHIFLIFLNQLCVHGFRPLSSNNDLFGLVSVGGTIFWHPLSAGKRSKAVTTARYTVWGFNVSVKLKLKLKNKK